MVDGEFDVLAVAATDDAEVGGVGHLDGRIFEHEVCGGAGADVESAAIGDAVEGAHSDQGCVVNTDDDGVVEVVPVVIGVAEFEVEDVARDGGGFGQLEM